VFICVNPYGTVIYIRKAVKGGGYSADKFIVGPEGGQVLVNETVRLVKEMWN